jgi:site-specific DNA recombinase
VRVATYTRISTDEDHQPYSLEAQAEHLGAYVKSQPDWELTRRFSDQASGASTERPGLTRALAEARAGRFDLLLVYRVDRFSRSVRGLAQLLEDLDAAGVAFRSATEPFDTTTAAGRMMVQMLAVFAEFERAIIVDRVIAGMERKAARGGWCGGSRPFGYDVDPQTGYLTPAPGEAPLVPVLFDRYAHGRDGARALAVWLNEAGHRTKAGRPWSHTAVLTVLRNPVYVGKVFFRDALHEGPHPHLVDDKLFDRVQALLTERGEDYSKRASATSPFLLAGLVVCARCGKHFVGTSAVGNRYRYRYYTCFTRQRYGTKYCDAERLPAEELDAAVLDALLHVYERTCSTRPLRRPGAGHAPSEATTLRSWPSSTQGSPRPKTPSSATSRRSSLGRSQRPSAASVSKASPRRCATSASGVRSWWSQFTRRRPPHPTPR